MIFWLSRYGGFFKDLTHRGYSLFPSACFQTPDPSGYLVLFCVSLLPSTLSCPLLIKYTNILIHSNTLTHAGFLSRSLSLSRHQLAGGAKQGHTHIFPSSSSLCPLCQFIAQFPVYHLPSVPSLLPSLPLSVSVSSRCVSTVDISSHLRWRQPEAGQDPPKPNSSSPHSQASPLNLNLSPPEANLSKCAPSRGARLSPLLSISSALLLFFSLFTSLLGNTFHGLYFLHLSSLKKAIGAKGMPPGPCKLRHHLRNPSKNDLFPNDFFFHFFPFLLPAGAFPLL